MRSRRTILIVVLCLCIGLVGLMTQAQIVKKTQSSLDDLAGVTPRANVHAVVMPAEDLRMEAAAMASPDLQDVVAGWDRFVSENGSQWQLLIDRRTGRAALAQGSGIPWIPGAGNSLQASDLGETLGASGNVTKNTLIKRSRQFMRQYPELFGVDTAEMIPSGSGTGEYGGYLWYVQFQRVHQGIPVENSYAVFRVNNGNLIQFGGEFLGAITVDTVPSFDPETAEQILGGYLGGFQPGDEWLGFPKLSILPLAPQGDAGFYNEAPGQGVDYHLVYTLGFRRQGAMGTWMAKVDANTGEVLMFVDANEYGSIKGGIYVTSNLDTEVVRPMGFADSASSTYANAAGTYTQTSGTVTTTLKGKYVKVTDSCGSISLSGTAPADLNLGTSSGTDCTTPGVGGSGNTHAARSTYYHLTLWKEKAMAWLPSNSWLPGQLTDKVNLNQTCNAYWDGSGVNFFKSGGGCSNTGELPTVFLHEVGHGLDSNDGSPSSTVGSSEAYADTNAILMTHNSCIGVNFFTDGSKCSGYGNACTTCTGIRDADYAKHTYSTSPAVPTQLTGTTGYHCSASSSYPGPCGREGHCESYIMSEVGWDIAARDLPSAGYDASTSWYIADRLFFLTRPTSGDAYSCPSVSTANGCGSSNWYETYLAADDDNGNLSDGTPHAAAIYAAYNRHAIACTTGSHTSYSACGTIGQPTLTASAGSGSVNLSWTAATGATKYKVLRNELGSTAGMTIIATPTTTSYTDTTVAIGITYYYSVLAVGSSDACFGALASVKSATPTAGATYSISGTVSGATASGVAMSLTGAATASATTDSSGNYTFSGLSNGSYTVTPSKSGYTFSPSSIAVTVSGANQTGKNFTATAVPTYSITGKVSGDTSSGVAVNLTGAATGNTTTDSSGNYSFSGLMSGSYTVTPSKSGYTFSPASIAVTISGANQTGKNFTATASACGGSITAVYSSAYHCPTCDTSGISCAASTSLLQCRGTTGESNAPNTIDGCADGNSGSCHSDESIEAITVAASDGSSCMAPGQQVTVTVSTYCYNTSDYVTLFYSTSGMSPSWTKVGSTQQAPGSGTRTFTWTFTLGGTAGSAQALRAQMTYNSDPGTAACLSGSYNDRDDLVFMVGGSAPATYSISGTVSGATASGVAMSLTGAATASATTDSSGNYTFSGLSNGSYTVTPSKSGYTFSPSSIAVTVSGANQTGKNFTATATGGSTTLFSNGFEASTGWAVKDTSGTAGSWTRVTSGTYPTCQEHSGSYMAKFNSYSASSGSQTRYYRTSGFAVSSSYSSVTLTFWMYHDTGYSSSADKVQVQVSTNGSTWTNVGSAVNRYDGSTGWKLHTIDLSAYKGQTVYLGFLGISAYGNNEYIDDATVVAQ